MSKLTQVATTTISSPVADFSIGGISDNSPHILMLNGINVASQNADIYMRLGDSSSADTSNEYDYASENLYTYSSFLTNASVDQSYWTNVLLNFQSSFGEGNAMMYFYNLYNSDEYSVVLFNNVIQYTGGNIYGVLGGGVLKVEAQHTHIYLGYGGNITEGTATLYKVGG